MGCLFTLLIVSFGAVQFIRSLLLLSVLLVWYPRNSCQVSKSLGNHCSFDTVLLYSFLCQRIDMGRFDLIGLEGRVSRYEADTFLPQYRLSRRVLLEVATAPDPPPRPKPVKMKVNRYQGWAIRDGFLEKSSYSWLGELGWKVGG